MKNLILLILLSMSFSALVQARDYRDKDVGDYSHASVDISVNRNNMTFLEFMKAELFAVISKEAPNQSHWKSRDYLREIRNGIGAELRLAHNITTYHVGYSDHTDKEGHKSGRSFGVYDEQPLEPGSNADYIADASYKFYLDELEEVLQDADQARIFYTAIFKLLVKTDASGFVNPEMQPHTARVAADFVAVYVAEQYRRLLHSQGKWLDRRNWDNAHLQTTILANFHAGQSDENRGMFFGGRYTTEPYRQKDSRSDNPEEFRCAYQLIKSRKKSDDKWLNGLRRRSFRLSDYWQFGSTCGGPSGVNVTRRDFEKLGRNITRWMNKDIKEQENTITKELFNSIWTASQQTMKTDRNVINAVADNLIDNRTTPSEYAEADLLIESLVEFTMAIREKALIITEEQLLN